jgi:hypothetical protein
VCAVVTGHALEVSRENRLLARDLLKSSAGVVLKALKLATNLWQRASDLLGKDLGLLQMGAPFFTILTNLTKLQLVSDSFDLELPFLLADV